MEMAATTSPHSNPFCTARTRPGAIPFLFDPGEDAATLIERLRSLRWRAQIVGPHGSGKTSLLAALRPALEAAGRDVQLVGLHQADRRLPLAGRDWREFTAAILLVVDGYEQLGRFARWSVERRCRRRGCGLLITTHRDLGLPTLFTTNPRLDLAMALVRQLLPGSDGPITDRDIESAWHSHQGNLREVLFRLYDLFEERRPTGR
jgi:hypothetical protein